MDQILNYTGQALQHGDKKLELMPYLPAPELVRAVNIALYLKKRPLLLMGEPGVGKTCLAESVAYELLGPEAMQRQYFRWNIKSTTKAKEGLYRYDSFRRLADAQVLKSKDERAQLNNLKLGDPESYIQRGCLAEAFAGSTSSQRSVILIDEIDKADIDFPNDLLSELENFEFTIPETGETVRRPPDFEFPLIIVTSNRERELPAAFLRRCLYHFINFPDTNSLKKIIYSKFGNQTESALVKRAVDAFERQREKLVSMEKKPSTSELLDWFDVLNHYHIIKQSNSKLSAAEQQMVDSLDELGTGKIPFAEVLLKTYETFTQHDD